MEVKALFSFLISLLNLTYSGPPGSKSCLCHSSILSKLPTKKSNLSPTNSTSEVTSFRRRRKAVLEPQRHRDYNEYVDPGLTKQFQNRFSFLVFSCPEQLIRWPCQWVTHSLTHSLTHGVLLIDIQRATQEICDLWNIWLEWWGDMNWPKKRQWQRQIQRQRQWQRQIHLESTFKERS